MWRAGAFHRCQKQLRSCVRESEKRRSSARLADSAKKSTIVPRAYAAEDTTVHHAQHSSCRLPNGYLIGAGLAVLDRVGVGYSSNFAFALSGYTFLPLLRTKEFACKDSTKFYFDMTPECVRSHMQAILPERVAIKSLFIQSFSLAVLKESDEGRLTKILSTRQ